MSQVPVTFQQLPPALIGQLQGMLRGLTGDVTPEALQAKEDAEAAAEIAVGAAQSIGAGDYGSITDPVAVGADYGSITEPAV